MTQTYFISTYHTMPILALTTDPKNLFNETDGMLADGNELDREAQKRPWMKAAYRQKKKNKGYIEWYDTDGRQRLSQGMIFSCMGQYSLDMPQKSFSIRANAQFGADTFDVAAFEDRPYTSYAAFALRNGGQDGLYTRVLDGLQQRLAEQSGTSVITQAMRPVIVYINGAYWGHYESAGAHRREDDCPARRMEASGVRRSAGRGRYCESGQRGGLPRADSVCQGARSGGRTGGAGACA